MIPAIGKKSKRRLQRLVLENWGLKILALVVAIGLFAIVRGAEDAQRSELVQVAPLLPPDTSGKVLVSEMPEEVRLTLQGSRSVLNAIQRDGIPPIQVDLRDPSRRYYYFDENTFEIPPGINIMQIAPATIRLSYARKLEKRIPIVPRLIGELESGLSLRAPAVVEPSSVIVYGPESKLNLLRNVSTAEIDLASFGEGIHNQQVPLQSPSDFVEYSNDSPVTIQFEITKKMTPLTFKKVKIVVLGSNGFSVRPSFVNIYLEGTSEEISSIDRELVVPFVESSGAAEGTSSVKVQMRNLPSSVRVTRIEPEEVLLTVVR